MSGNEKSVASHYDAIAAGYHTQYERQNLRNTSMDYPANYFRLQLLLNSFVAKGLRRVIEVGVGEGTPLSTLAAAGIDVWGFDISEAMVARCKETVAKKGLSPEKIFWGDIQDSTTFTHALKDGPFDGLMAMGVMPHVANDEHVLRNMSGLIRPGGSVFVEFRNKLFSLFTFNRCTYEFILDDLLKDAGEEIKEIVAADLKSRLRMDMPPRREKQKDSDAPGYDAILSKFHNPFETVELFKRCGFKDVRLLWYHYHAGLPYLETMNPELFRTEALRLEHETSNWRGFFLCSAFVVEAVRQD